MYLKTEDGKVIFATHLINVTIPKEHKEKFYLFQVELDKIICYSIEEKNAVEIILQKEGFLYSVEIIAQDPDYLIKSDGIKYNSRSEAIAHLLEDTEPESQIIANLKKEKEELKIKLTQTEDALLTLMFNS